MRHLLTSEVWSLLRNEGRVGDTFALVKDVVRVLRAGATEAVDGRTTRGVPAPVLVSALQGLLTLGSHDRLPLWGALFDGDGDGYLSWQELEPMLSTIGQAQALAMRDGLLNFPALPAAQEDTADGASSSEESRGGDSREEADGGAQRQATVKTAAMYEKLGGVVVARELAQRTARAVKEEDQWLRRHARVWHLHDLDALQKWRCSFAWAPRTKAAPPSKRTFDLMGNASLEGFVTVDELLASQKGHFAVLNSPAEHFLKSYRTKRLERYFGILSDRETARYGVVFVIAVGMVDNWVGLA